MDEKKEGVSVRELEEFAKKHRFEVFFCLLFVLACIFGTWGIFFRTGFNVFALSAGAILSVLLYSKVDTFLRRTMQFIFKQDKTVQIVFGAVALLLAVFLPFVIFFLVGIAGGKALYQMANDLSRAP